MTPWISMKRHWIPLGFLTMGMATTFFSRISPWPACLLIRALFESEGRKTAEKMRPYEPSAGVVEILDVAYGKGGADTTCDIFIPSDSAGPFPAMVWIHGGAWISGDKSDVSPYAKIISSSGYTTVAVNYTVAPEAIYPTALGQLNDALRFVVEHAAEYRIDPNRIVLAGDSAGAQLAAQLATMISNPDYTARVAIPPALTPGQLRAVVLQCGIFDVSGIPEAPGIGGWGFRTALWAYLGRREWSGTPGGALMGVLDHVTSDFPATWISGGNADPLTAMQSKPMAARLSDLGVDVTSVFYPDDTTPELPHEYQFHLDLANSQLALASTVAFLDRVTR
ncbi:alpha/beta hydrolase [Nakamurella antarctica]|uniref:Alpha/beta hydrolase n=1 Tax=Nakamurella antarctica TaxID=1902245 RepID=A0A3G8ZIE1_9ACTN|nr:alpha/beta hydrolase [Nakamurella antarctica]AZI56948.1 alpha/beta hydrolase [Nakamurella antarctica]